MEANGLYTKYLQEVAPTLQQTGMLADTIQPGGPQIKLEFRSKEQQSTAGAKELIIIAGKLVAGEISISKAMLEANLSMEPDLEPIWEKAISEFLMEVSEFDVAGFMQEYSRLRKAAIEYSRLGMIQACRYLQQLHSEQTPLPYSYFINRVVSEVGTGMLASLIDFKPSANINNLSALLVMGISTQYIDPQTVTDLMADITLKSLPQMRRSADIPSLAEVSQSLQISMPELMAELGAELNALASVLYTGNQTKMESLSAGARNSNCTAGSYLVGFMKNINTWFRIELSGYDKMIIPIHSKLNNNHGSK